MYLEEILRRHDVDVSSLSRPEYQRAGEEHPIYLLQVPVAQALVQWEILRHLVPETRYWPVIGWDRFKKPFWEEKPVQKIVASGLRVNLPQWFAQKRLSEGSPRDEEIEADTKVPLPFVFRLHLRGSSQLVPIALIPTVNCWEVPAYITVTVNDWDPSPEVQVAILKYWNERWRAEIVSSAGGAAMEMRVLQPPTLWEDALALAHEQYLYCPDLIDQQLGNIRTLAKLLLNGSIWQFWWD